MKYAGVTKANSPQLEITEDEDTSQLGQLKMKTRGNVSRSDTWQLQKIDTWKETEELL